MMKKTLSFLGLLLLTTASGRAAVETGDFVYELDEEAMTATVTNCVVKDTMAIPETIQHDGHDYAVTAIGDWAFKSSPKALSIPRTVKEIGVNGLNECGTLYITDLEAWCNIEFREHTVSHPCKFTTYSRFSPEKASLDVYLNGELLTDLVIPESITSVSGRLFYGWNISSVTLHPDVKSIGKEAFYLCSKLTTVRISDLSAWCRISFDGELANPLNAYNGGSQTRSNDIHRLLLNGEEVRQLSIPEDVGSIGRYAFYGFCALKSLSIPSGVTAIGNYAFCRCDSLSDVSCYAETPPVTELTEEFEGYCTFGYANEPPAAKAVLHVPGTAVEDYGRQSPWADFMGIVPIGAELECTEFEEAGIRYMVCSATGVTLVGGEALPEDGKMDISTVVHDGQTYEIVEIGAGALMNNKALKALSFGNSVKVIGPQAFMGCRNLAEMDHLPYFLEQLGDSAFTDCGNLRIQHVLPSEVTGGNYMFFPKTLRQQEPPYSGAGAFNGCESLESLLQAFDQRQLPTSWTEIPERMFSGISPISGTLWLPSSIRRIRKEAFCGDGFQTVSLSEGLEAVEEKALYGVLATDITLPATVKELGCLAIGRDPSADPYNGPLKRITCLAPVPPVNDPRGAFNADVYETAELIVPDESLELYMAAPDWQRFKNIRGANGRTGITGVHTRTDTAGTVYDLQGRRLTKQPRKGVYIQDGRKVVVK